MEAIGGDFELELDLTRGRHGEFIRGSTDRNCEPSTKIVCRHAMGEQRGGRIMRFREEPVMPVYRRWMCEEVGCDGELVSTGEGITRLSTRWKHRCGKCGHEDPVLQSSDQSSRRE